MQVLVAEDDLLSQEMLRSFLEPAGYDVLLTNNGETAWKEFVAHAPQIVITDWNMPGLTGLELCRRIRQHNGKYVYVILVTANSETEHFVAGLEAGADEFITKPFDAAELRARLEVGRRILKLEDRLAEQVANLEASKLQLETTAKRLREELDAGADLQRSLLPAQQPDSPVVDCSWAFQPCDQLGGDGLNFYELADDRIGFSITDVCGHGVKAALLAVTVQNVLNPRSRQTPLKWADSAMSETYRVVPPPEVLARLNDQFPMDMSVGQYFTMLYAVLETDSGRLCYSSAGHPPPILVPANGDIVHLSGGGLPIGLSELSEFEHEEIRLNPNDRVILFSDGLPEARQFETGPIAGIHNVIAWLEESRALATKQVADHLLQCVSEWTGDNPDDDISILVIEYVGAAAPKVAKNSEEMNAV